MKLSWPKTLVKKWLNIQSKDGDFHADDIIYSGTLFFISNLLFSKIESHFLFLFLKAVQSFVRCIVLCIHFAGIASIFYFLGSALNTWNFFFTFSGVDEELRNNFSEREICTIKKSQTGSLSNFWSFFWTTVVVLLIITNMCFFINTFYYTLQYSLLLLPFFA